MKWWGVFKLALMFLWGWVAFVIYTSGEVDVEFAAFMALFLALDHGIDLLEGKDK